MGHVIVEKYFVLFEEEKWPFWPKNLSWGARGQAYLIDVVLCGAGGGGKLFKQRRYFLTL